MFNNLNALLTRAERNEKRGRCVEEREGRTTGRVEGEQGKQSRLSADKAGNAEAGESGARRKM